MSALGAPSPNKPANVTRTAVLGAVRRSERPIAVQEIAAELDLHANSVRFHLSRLLQAGQLREDQADPDGPGRPRMVYTALPVPDRQPEPGAASGGAAAQEPVPASAPAAGSANAAEAEGRGYQFLAEMLAGHLAATADDPGTTASGVGEAWGRYLAGRPVPFSRATEEESVAQVAEILDRAGFSPALSDEDGYRIELRTCPFRTVADRQPGVVCSIHLGLMRGVLSETSAPVEVTRLDRFEAPYPCVTQLRAIAAADGPGAGGGRGGEDGAGERDGGKAGGDYVENLPGWAGRIAG